MIWKTEKQERKSIKPKAVFFEIKKMDKSLAMLIRDGINYQCQEW